MSFYQVVKLSTVCRGKPKMRLTSCLILPLTELKGSKTTNTTLLVLLRGKTKLKICSLIKLSYRRSVKLLKISGGEKRGS